MIASNDAPVTTLGAKRSAVGFDFTIRTIAARRTHGEHVFQLIEGGKVIQESNSASSKN